MSNQESSQVAQVRFVNVDKSYDGRSLVVANLNLNIDNGEFVSLLGPSGSGKTTCLMMLAGFEPVTRGQILLNDKPIQHIPPNKRNIGMVFQNYALFPHMTVAENLAFPLQVRNRSKAEIEQRIQEVLSMVRLEGFADRRVTQLSGGQQQRVAVARAIAFNPAIVLMDEPLGALDKNLREELQFEIKRLHHRLGITVIYVTHDQSEAVTMSDRVAVFNDGKIQQLSTPQVLYDHPQNTFVANFIGENNLFSGTVKSCEDQRCSVSVGDHLLEGVPVRALESKQPAQIAVRPEKMVINPAENQCCNVLSGTVTECIYMGDHTRVLLTVADGASVVIKVMNHEQIVSYKQGERLQIGWNAQQSCVLGSDGNQKESTDR